MTPKFRGGRSPRGSDFGGSRIGGPGGVRIRGVQNRGSRGGQNSGVPGPGSPGVKIRDLSKTPENSKFTKFGKLTKFGVFAKPRKSGVPGPGSGGLGIHVFSKPRTKTFQEFQNFSKFFGILCPGGVPGGSKSGFLGGSNFTNFVKFCDRGLRLSAGVRLAPYSGCTIKKVALKSRFFTFFLKKTPNLQKNAKKHDFRAELTLFFTFFDAIWPLLA